MASRKLLLALAGGISFTLKPSVIDLFTLAGLKIFIAVLCVEYVILGLYEVFIYPYYFSPLRHIPGPKNTNPLLGHLPSQIFAPSPNRPFLTWMQRFASNSTDNGNPPPFIRYFGLLGSESLLITNLEAINEVHVKHPYAFTKPAVQKKFLSPIIGKGLFFTETQEEHLGIRKRMNRPFSITNLKRLVSVFRDKAGELGDKIGRYADATGDGEGVVVDVAAEYTSTTLDIIGVAALGVELGSLESKTPFRDAYIHIFDPSPFGAILWGLSMFIPLRWLPLKENKLFLEATSTVRGLTSEIIRNRIRDMWLERDGLKKKVDRKDLLTFLLEEDLGGASGQSWDEEELLGHMLNFMAAGHETTATALTWATHAMAIRKNVQTGLRKEVQEMLKEHPEPGYTEIESLKLLSSFCKEVFRFYSPSVAATRSTVAPLVICDTLVPAGTTVNLIFAAIHYNKQIWGPDADVFRPSRWEDKDQNLDSLGLAGFLVGYRVCIGRTFAILEMKAILIEMLSRFEFSPMDGVKSDEDVKVVNPSPVLKPLGGLRVKVRRI
ncbi:cytochrome P450 [Rhypophila decipiens]|uniref:Cytochrome P450 n=1 Tax=Rhypophila decipiens TaxID=261697 RepID=A0AAN6Y6P7_9PEZI|nr:cytochrome P450 [Rhypophila decipiens]